ncbi:uncharacterized protein LOC111293429 [Durio zibethinus]|uniref:Uncharacterized protein LOC111293429 n=1 Tax=Durio zibethinus TaxID=66656 RepID=A0A6P5YNN7_DURZI|nr:uncharacterized protein LOC111293429 [Durio zibethinus]
MIKVISWNVRGLGSRTKKKALKKLISKQILSMIFLQETKNSPPDSRFLKYLWSRDAFKGEWVGSNGRSGGLISLWSEQFFTLESSFINHRFTLLQDTINALNIPCIFVNIYAHNDPAERNNLWNELIDVKNLLNPSNLWCIGGNFSIIKCLEENRGISYDLASMSSFVNFINSMDLVDLQLNDGLFSWSDNKEIPTMCRLDPFLLSSDLLTKFPTLHQNVLPKSLSDHNPICLSVEDKNWGLKPFRLFSHWMGDAQFLEMFNNSWQATTDSSKAPGIFNRLKALKFIVKNWQQDYANKDAQRIS